MKRVSVVTIVKDHESGLRTTIDSLLGQTFQDWEMIIVVGASNDSSLMIAQEACLADSRVRLIDQESVGIYNAMNEGINEASGEFIWFMNAGDKFATPHILMHATTKLLELNVGILIGGYSVDSSDANRGGSYSEKNLTPLSFAFNRRGGCHQSMLFQAQLLKRMGGFNPDYSLASDFDLVLKVILRAKATRVPEVYAIVEPGGRADQGIFEVHNQKHKIRRNFFSNPLISILSLMWTGLARAKILTRRSFR